MLAPAGTFELTRPLLLKCDAELRETAGASRLAESKDGPGSRRSVIHSVVHMWIT